jgi:ammonium transporter, Amt family
MLTCCALVLFMTAPGLAMFYSGLVRKKNVLSVMMQCIFLMGLMTVLWGLYGYSLVRRRARRLHRQRRLPVHERCQRHLGRNRRPARSITPDGGDAHPAPDAHALSRHVLHHHAGADLRRVCRADEVQHDGRVLDPVGTLVYCPLCHWVWGGGILAYGAKGAIGWAARSTSPAARSSTSAPASRP